MILIADSGSTKTTWHCIGNNSELLTCNTSGINPFFLNTSEIQDILNSEFTIDKSKISAIYFYGAGCALPEKKQVLFDALKHFFCINQIQIESDLFGAARSLCQNAAGIACILGTGSNSCFYDGKQIVHNVSPLGYVLGDEGSGAVLGKKLLGDILKNQLPEHIRQEFFDTYKITAGEILESVYRKPFPNRFLAQYTRFIAKHVDKPEMQDLLNNSFQEFFTRNIFQYKEAVHLPLHFTGSIAYVFRDNIEKVATLNGMKVGKITQAPIDGLIEYHSK